MPISRSPFLFQWMGAITSAWAHAHNIRPTKYLRDNKKNFGVKFRTINFEQKKRRRKNTDSTTLFHRSSVSSYTMLITFFFSIFFPQPLLLLSFFVCDLLLCSFFCYVESVARRFFSPTFCYVPFGVLGYIRSTFL